MDIVKWRSSYETGISSMDGQHKKLINLVNTMYRVLRGREDGSSVAQVLKEMGEYAEVHFAAEESLLSEHGFPEFEAHVASHNGFREKLKILVSEMENDETENDVSQRNIYTFLRHWLLEHIVQEDKEYGAYLKERGCS